MIKTHKILEMENSCLLIARVYMKVSLNAEKRNRLRNTTSVLCTVPPQATFPTVASIIFQNLKFDLHKTCPRQQRLLNALVIKLRLSRLGI